MDRVCACVLCECMHACVFVCACLRMCPCVQEFAAEQAKWSKNASITTQELDALRSGHARETEALVKVGGGARVCDCVCVCMHVWVCLSV